MEPLQKVSNKIKTKFFCRRISKLCNSVFSRVFRGDAAVCVAVFFVGMLPRLVFGKILQPQKQMSPVLQNQHFPLQFFNEDATVAFVWSPVAVCSKGGTFMFQIEVFLPKMLKMSEEIKPQTSFRNLQRPRKNPLASENIH